MFMRKKHNKVIAFLLIFAMLIQIGTPAFNQPVYAAEYAAEPTFTMTENSFTIDGVTVTKSELLQALHGAKRMPECTLLVLRELIHSIQK